MTGVPEVASAASSGETSGREGGKGEGEGRGGKWRGIFTSHMSTSHTGA